MRISFFLKPLITILLLLLSVSTFSQDIIIRPGDTWMYYDTGYLNNSWAKDSLYTTSWKKGVTPIGYGDKKITTEIYFGENKDNKHITKYFKKSFILNNPEKYIAYELKIQKDDGIVLYLNGKEIYRNNMPKGKITGKTEAIYSVQSSSESIYHSKIIDAKEFQKGINTLSASIHQSNPSSSDCIFNLEMLGHNNTRVLSVLIDEKGITNNKLEAQINSLSHEVQLNTKTLKIDFLISSNEKLKIIMFLLAFLLVVAVTLAYYMILKYRKKDEQSTNNLLKSNESSFNKDREIMTMTTQLLHNKQYFKEIKAELNYIKTDNATAIKKLIQQIDFMIENDDEWEQLKKHFNTVYSGFYDILIDLHPTLTEIELRHCMFIKLHMQTKEIARILHIDPRSVQASRYRIKKKMGLNEDTDLRNYIIHIA